MSSAAATASARRSSRRRWPPRVFAELAAAKPRRHFTVGIDDDLGGASLPADPSFSTEPDDVVRCVFYGLGSDGTVGANKNSAKIIGTSTPLYAQAYFVYDSKKSGSTTVSHLRFGPRPIRSSYLISRRAVRRLPPVRPAEPDGRARRRRRGRDVPARQRRTARTRSGSGCRARRRSRSSRKDLRLHVIDAKRVAREARPARARSTRCCRRASSRSQACCRRSARSARSRRRSRRRTRSAARRSSTATSAPSTSRSTRSTRSRSRPRPDAVPAATNGHVPRSPTTRPTVLRALMAGEGDLLPVSALPADGTFPLGHGPVREAEPRRGAPDLGRDALHRLREVRARLPARRDPDEGRRPRGARGRARGLPLEGVARQGPARAWR